MPERFVKAPRRTLQRLSSRPAPAFGYLLPPRIPESTGSVISVTTWAELETQLASAPLGSIIDLGGATLTDPSSGGLSWSRVGSASQVTTIRNGVINMNGQVSGNDFFITGKYLRLRNLEITNCWDCIKFNGSDAYVEIDSCTLHGAYRQGILGGSGTHDNHQIWNSRIYQNGSAVNGTLDHGIYAGGTFTNLVIANCEIYNNQAYNVQLYPSPSVVYVVGNTLDGGVTRGGMVWDGAANVIAVGNVITNTPSGQYAIKTTTNSNNKAYDCIAYNAPLGFGSSMTDSANLVISNPLYKSSTDRRLAPGSPAINFVRSDRYGYLPDRDINGVRRITADAGCYAYAG